MRVAAILLAAGGAERFGGPSKLLAELGGFPLIVHAARAIAGSATCHVAVVTGRDAGAIETALSPFAFQFVHNTAWADGMGGSIAAGVLSLPAGVDAALIVPGDMPFLTPALLNSLAETFDAATEPRPIVFPQLPDGTQLNPVLWPKRYFSELSLLSGPSGGKQLLRSLAEQSAGIIVNDARLVADIDTKADLEAARRNLG